jgi:hypothetical protein
MASSPVLDVERKANGWSHLRIVVVEGLFVIVVWLLLVQDYDFRSRRYGGMRQGWRRLASVGAFGGMSRGWRRATVLPGGGGGGGA